MRFFCLILLGVLVGWGASDIQWNREAAGQDAPARAPGAERSIRPDREGVLRRRGLLPPRDPASPAPTGEAPPYQPSGEATPDAAMESGATAALGFEVPQGANRAMEELGDPIAAPTRAAAATGGLLGRFQASAYGAASGHGCYVVDTMTGAIWHVSNAQPPQLVTAALTAHASGPQPASIALPPPMLTAPAIPSLEPQTTPQSDAAE
ncbi:hypothetical protein [Lacipirellula limnantheis]|uniref:Uncharacterized protein n=1 Tax=Lacipirellula limnantheis TaxID=2528024 RepID=A0A517U5J9_9BACT|nr:hypothetical protein [Lacipirellula limnantheis]QDT75907.1 hypothetical protein I41_51520 [Lacipirellula limnantheis]